uniref:Uncharacterized protein n=1 Tax=Pyxicephalus adspersus TaxID=30357 RepID=A0AAV3AHE0_PYXAD|nr:TPA: hypothetical protein GDO54_018054 [Pyxicephalus adspersus]
MKFEIECRRPRLLLRPSVPRFIGLTFCVCYPGTGKWDSSPSVYVEGMGWETPVYLTGTEMHNAIIYRQVRHYTTDHKLVQFYFLTRVSSEYIESVLDVIRYHEQSLQMYKSNLDYLFIRLTKVLSPKCLVICNMSTSVGFKAEGNFYSTTLADLHKLDVIDLHFHLRFKLRSKVKDATHSNQLAHRKYTCILMTHID